MRCHSSSANTCVSPALHAGAFAASSLSSEPLPPSSYRDTVEAVLGLLLCRLLPSPSSVPRRRRTGGRQSGASATSASAKGRREATPCLERRMLPSAWSSILIARLRLHFAQNAQTAMVWRLSWRAVKPVEGSRQTVQGRRGGGGAKPKVEEEDDAEEEEEDVEVEDVGRSPYLDSIEERGAASRRRLPVLPQERTAQACVWRAAVDDDVRGCCWDLCWAAAGHWGRVG